MVSASYSNWRNRTSTKRRHGSWSCCWCCCSSNLAKKYLKPKADKALQRGRNELHLKRNPIGAGARGLDKQSYEPEGEVGTARDA